MMERRIEYRYLRDLFAEQLPRRANAFDVVWIVQRRKIDTILDALQYSAVDERGFWEEFSAVHHAMADRMYVGRAFDLRDP